MKYEKKRGRAGRIVLLIAWLCLIWGHSMMPRAASAQESEGLLTILVQYLPFLTEYALRKLAHVCEFGVLGMLMSWNTFAERGCSRKTAMLTIGACWFTAFLDETIQIFSGRSAEILDVWIDLSGAVMGVAVVGLIATGLTRRCRT